ncbi:hypothetical protein [Pseudarthrobacter sp. NIBRBAC000502772]|uniref:hypothetical protein n=1 Tax=Pseudarthrobacter sp. NIBRBAC000502772 TaxID=2590775 RepID=UPI001FEF7DDA|nr:hypothetical protein [Pseudarthrobacter sp. NIBRBAC000502772]
MNFIAPGSGIYDFIMNSTGLVALFVYVFIAVTQWRLRSRMTAEECSNFKLKVAIMMVSDAGGTQVLTSFTAAGPC